MSGCSAVDQAITDCRPTGLMSLQPMASAAAISRRVRRSLWSSAWEPALPLSGSGRHPNALGRHRHRRRHDHRAFKLMLNTSDIDKIQELALGGQVGHIDLRVGDISEKPLPGLNLEVTASNFGKASSRAKFAKIRRQESCTWSLNRSVRQRH